MKEEIKEDLRPRAKTTNLVVIELPEEELVYDLKAHKAYCLNQTAAAVWHRCNGQTTISEIVQAVSHDFQREMDEAAVLLALRQLSRASLLECEIAFPAYGRRISRRQALCNLGLTGLGVPLITTIIAPQAALAASCIPSGAGVENECMPAGTVGNNCCSGCCGSTPGITPRCRETGLSPGATCRAPCSCLSNSCVNPPGPGGFVCA